MSSAIEFVVILLTVMVAVLGFGIFATVRFRKVAHTKRLKRHFASKVQDGRPTHS